MITRELEMTFNLAVREAEKRRHDLVCLEHILFAMLQETRAQEILRRCGVDLAGLRRDLQAYLDKQESVPDGRKLELEQTVAVSRVLRRAAIHVQSAGKKEIDAGDVLAAMFREQDSHAIYLLQKQGVSRLDVLDFISHGVAKQGQEGDEQPVGESDAEREGGEGRRKKGDALGQYCENLMHKARAGRIDPLIGRHKELLRCLHVLCRRRKNNPIFVGEPGVGKTAIAEGLALAISQDKVPKLLQGAEIFALDMGALIAGTKFRGEFEQRLKQVVQAIRDHKNAILFIDEIHTIVGAGAVSGGTLDASNILKPALASGELRCIGSTTYKEYQQSFERDRALTRRFQKIDVKEPSLEDTVLILRGLKAAYESHHEVVYSPSSLRLAAELAHKHLADRFLPDSALDVLDEAGSANRLLPQGKKRSTIRPRDIKQVIATMARIAALTVSGGEKNRLSAIDRELKLVVYGQDHAVDAVVTAIKLSRAGLGSDHKPVGSFIFAGPTGVGKTELARQLAKSLGVELLRFDMSEYSEKHTVSRLIGAPPGYVGYDQGGLLTDAVIKTPHAVLLLDELEKAHPEIYNILLQVMDHATLTDNNGRKADFRNVVLIMTTNAGARDMEATGIGFGSTAQASNAKASLERAFSPEFRNRLDAVLTFGHLARQVIDQVVEKFVSELEAQLHSKRIELELTPAAKAYLAENGYDKKNGARPIGRLIDQQVRRPLADKILFGELQDGGTVRVELTENALRLHCTPRASRGAADEGEAEPCGESEPG